MFRIIACLTLALFLSPDRPAPKKLPPKQMLPTIISGVTNWGQLEQSGTSIKITGHAVWEAIGNVRADGKVYLLWTLKSTGEACPSVYTVLPGGALEGVWGYGGRCMVNEKGELIGETHSDRVIQAEN